VGQTMGAREGAGGIEGGARTIHAIFPMKDI
jgi:hypothetical protein